ncbi:MAG: TlpA family protein disulfide reductase [Deltaproteobacteria bacterium]|nr:TlpA family protein disulfide reductase [Deltaproteobacteria bacterium]
MKSLRFFLVVLCAALLAGPVNQAIAAAPMPHFNLPSVTDGKAMNSDAFQGKVLLITFFATWCPPCMQEIPSLISLQEEFGAKGFSVVAISVDQGGTKSVQKLVEKRGINYPVLMADSKITDDFGGIVGIPTSFLVNQQGSVIKNYPGYVTHNVLVEDIKQLIK